MKTGRWFGLLPVLLVLAMALPAAPARAQGELAPENAAATMDRLELRCRIAVLCPYSPEIWEVFRAAAASKPADQHMLGIYLMTGDKVPRDERGGLHWIGLAAAHGYARAALELNRLRRNGTEMDVDEVRVAAAMRTQADAGDVDAMRALSEMYIVGRGVARDPDAGVRLLRAAADTGPGEAAQDLAMLFFRGAPGVPPDHAEALRWMGRASRSGNTEAMRILSYWLLTSGEGTDAAVIEGYRWLLRAALLDDPDAQERLSQFFADGMDERGHAVATSVAAPEIRSTQQAEKFAAHAIEALNALPGASADMRERFNRMLQPPAPPRTLVAPDLVQADLWFRLAARNPWHDNPQIRGAIEPRMTSAQLDEARRRVATWHPLPLPEVLALDLPLPAQ